MRWKRKHARRIDRRGSGAIFCRPHRYHSAKLYQTEASQNQAEQELGRAREALEKELVVSQQIKTAELEKVDFSEDGQPWPIMVAKHLSMEFKKELTQKLREYKDVFTWS